MPSHTDMLSLNKLDAFQNLRNTLETGNANDNISNLLAYKDQMVYVWNQNECCLYAILLTSVHEVRPLYQVIDQIYLNIIVYHVFSFFFMSFDIIL